MKVEDEISNYLMGFSFKKYKHLLLCRVLVGRPFIAPAGGNSNIPDGYNSKLVAPDVDGKAQMIVIDKEDQILPAFRIVKFPLPRPPAPIKTQTKPIDLSKNFTSAAGVASANKWFSLPYQWP